MTTEDAAEPGAETVSFTAFVLLHRPRVVAVLNSTSRGHRAADERDGTP